MVHQFIAALEKKDAVTRDHVVRVAELAMRAGIRAGLSAHQLRTLGIAALLHDIGKLDAPPWRCSPNPAPSPTRSSS